jgi:gluconate kinase
LELNNDIENAPQNIKILAKIKIKPEKNILRQTNDLSVFLTIRVNRRLAGKRGKTIKKHFFKMCRIKNKQAE